jgi:hypothetical protein
MGTRSTWLMVAAVLASGALVLLHPAPTMRPPHAVPRTVTTRSEPRPTRSSTRVRLTASQFLVGYLPYLHGQRAANSIPSATRALLARLAAGSPIVPPAARTLTPHVVSLATAGSLKLAATVNDGELPSYQLTLQLVDEGGRLLVANVEGAQ